MRQPTATVQSRTRAGNPYGQTPLPVLQEWLAAEPPPDEQVKRPTGYVGVPQRTASPSLYHDSDDTSSESHGRETHLPPPPPGLVERRARRFSMHDDGTRGLLSGYGRITGAVGASRVMPTLDADSQGSLNVQLPPSRPAGMTPMASLNVPKRIHGRGRGEEPQSQKMSHAKKESHHNSIVDKLFGFGHRRCVVPLYGATLDKSHQKYTDKRSLRAIPILST